MKAWSIALFRGLAYVPSITNGRCYDLLMLNILCKNVSHMNACIKRWFSCKKCMIIDEDLTHQIVWNSLCKNLVPFLHNWWLTLHTIFVADLQTQNQLNDYFKTSVLLLRIQKNNVALFAKSESIVWGCLYLSRDCVKIRSTTNFPLVL